MVHHGLRGQGAALREVMGQIPLFEGLPKEALAELAENFAPQWLPDGAYLFHEGEPALQFFLLAEGCLEVVGLSSDHKEDILLKTVSAPGAVGELAILRGERRDVSVRARGKTLVYALDSMAFINVFHAWPQMAIVIARQTAERLVQGGERLHGKALVSAWGVLLEGSMRPEFVLALVREALSYQAPRNGAKRVIVIAPQDVGEGQGGVEVRPLSPGLSPDQVEHLILSAREEANLVVIAGPLSALRGGLGSLSAVISHNHIQTPPLYAGARHIRLVDKGPLSVASVRASPLPQAAARVARILLNASVGVALGGGAALGIAHLGVLQALEELNVPVDFLAGTSSGAVLGAAYLAQDMRATLRGLDKLQSPRHWLRLVDPALLGPGLLTGDALMGWFSEEWRVKRIEELSIPFATVAMNLTSGEEEVFRQGNLVEAVRASMSFPGIFVPYAHRASFSNEMVLYVDGGLINNVPVDVVRSMGASWVIGVHVMPLRSLEAKRSNSRAVRALSRLVTAIPTLHRGALTLKSQFTAISRASERQVFNADLAIIPNTSVFSVFDFWSGRELIEVGRQGALELTSQLRLLARRR